MTSYEIRRLNDYKLFFHLCTIEQTFTLLTCEKLKKNVIYEPKLTRFVKNISWGRETQFLSLRASMREVNDFIFATSTDTKSKSYNMKVANSGDIISYSELEVVSYLSQSFSQQEIAFKLAKHHKTISSQKVSAMKKAGFESKIKFMAYLTTNHYN
jgi:DNA-binding CsgD family transcriptional regulator